MSAGVVVADGRRNTRRVAALWGVACLSLPLSLFCLDGSTEPLRMALLSLPVAKTVMTAVQPLGKLETLTPVLLVVFLVLRYARWPQAKAWLLTTLLALIVSGVAAFGLKLAVRRERPAVTSDRIQAGTAAEAIATGKCMSFPSGDTTAAFAAAWVLAAFAPWPGVMGFALAALVGLSRIYFGCHFISDVVAGALLGCLSAHFLLARHHRRHMTRDT